QSDHPALNSRYLLYEAQQAHYYALVSVVTPMPATTTGMKHHIRILHEGADAAVVLWGSPPL
ncbi:uncharacterized protein LAESUDRAFT_656132, partial [Laetiporus sulphureus 93-53]